MLALLPLLAVSHDYGNFELTRSNFAEVTARKTVVIRFFVQGCRLDPSWNRELENAAGKSWLLVAEVDCSRKGRGLCDDFRIRQYPRYWFSVYPEDIWREVPVRFIDGFVETLRPPCSASDMTYCSFKAKQDLEDMKRLPLHIIEAQIKQREDKIASLNVAFDAEADSIKTRIQELEHEKSRTISSMKDSYYIALKKVQSYYFPQGLSWYKRLQYTYERMLQVFGFSLDANICYDND